MTRKMFGAIGVATTACLAGCSSGGTSCTTEPQSSWMPEAQMQSLIAKQGYKVNEFKISGSCYEIYGWDRDGQKVEVYFNPVNGEIVKSEVE